MFTLNEDEWETLTQIYRFLKHFKNLSEKFGGQKYDTLPTVIVAFHMLIDKIQNIVHDLDNKADRSKVNEILMKAFEAVRDKILRCIGLGPTSENRNFQLYIMGS